MQEADLIEIALNEGEFKPSSAKRQLLSQVNRELSEWIRSQDGFDPKSVRDGRSPAISDYYRSQGLFVKVFGLTDREHILATVDRYWELLQGSNVRIVGFQFYREEVKTEAQTVTRYEPRTPIARLELSVPEHL